MAKDDNTVYGGDTTQPDGRETKPDAGAATPDIEATVPDGSKTTADEDATVPEETLPGSGAAVPQTVFIEKGGLLLHTYRVETDAIAGGMGRVWRVRHTGWNTDLAMKQPKAELFRTEGQKENFIRECDAWINLGLHPHIVSCYYVREVGGVPTIFSEWMDGGSLKNSIDSGALYEGEEKEALKRILDISLQFARGLNYAQEAGLIHQDVKPDNLLLSREGEAKVADFGIARARAALTVPESEKTADKTMFSAGGAYTPMYCSPEQMNGEKLTRRTDVWSWAVSVLEMFLGERPWMNGVVAGMCCEDYFGMARIPVPKKMRALLGQCFEENEADRPHDFAQVIKALLDIYGEATGEEYPRARPKAAADTADSLNNRALSYLDLGKPQEAEKLWERSLEKDPNHLATLYNQGLYLWRAGSIDDEEIIRRCSASKQAAYAGGFAKRWLSQLNAERGTGDAVSEADRTGRVLSGFTYGPQACISRDGLSIVTVDKDLRVWDTASGDCRFTIEADRICGKALCLSADETKAVFGGYDKKVKIFDIGGRQITCELSGHTGNISALCIHPDGKHCYSGSEDQTIRKWNMKTGECEKVFSGYEDRIVAVCCSPDGRSLYASYRNQAIIKWNEETAKPVKTLRFEPNAGSLLLSSDGRRLYAGGDHNIVIRDAGDLSRVSKIDSRGLSHRIGLSRDGKRLVAGNSDGNIKIWDTQSERCLQTLFGHTGPILSVGMDDSGETLVSGSGDETVRIWSLRLKSKAPWELSTISSYLELADMQTQYASLCEAARAALSAHEISEALKRINEASAFVDRLSASESRRIRNEVGRYCQKPRIQSVYEVFGQKIFQGQAQAASAQSVAANKAGSLCAVGMDWMSYGAIELWDVDECLPMQALPGEKGKGGSGVNSLCLSADGHVLAAGQTNDLIALWDVRAGKRIRVLSGHERDPSSAGIAISLSPDGRRLASGGGDGTARVWDMQSGNCLHVLCADKDRIPAVCYSPDGQNIFAGDGAGVLRMWDAQSGAMRKAWDEHSYMITSVCVTADGRRVITGSVDGSVLIRNAATGSVEATLLPHDGNSVQKMCVSTDGKLLATCDLGHVIKLLDTNSRQCLHTISVPERFVHDLCFSADGNRLFACCDTMLRSWAIEYDYEFPGWTDWDEEARPYLKTFLAQNPNWTDGDFDGLIAQLQDCGLGWIRPEGVKKNLSEMK